MNWRHRGQSVWTRDEAVAFFVACVTAIVACIGVRPAVCEGNSDCGSGAVCGGAGFCISECTAASDCPCGAFCAQSCGLCLRTDFAGPATCFAYQNGLDTTGVLGACRSDIGDASTPAAAGPVGLADGPLGNVGASAEGGGGAPVADGAGSVGSATEARVCDQPPISLPSCLQSPPNIDAAPGSDAPSKSDQPADAADDGADATENAADDGVGGDAADGSTEALSDVGAAGPDGVADGGGLDP